MLPYCTDNTNRTSPCLFFCASTVCLDQDDEDKTWKLARSLALFRQVSNIFSKFRVNISCLALGDDVAAAGDGLYSSLLHSGRSLETVRVHSAKKLVLQSHRVEVFHHLKTHKHKTEETTQRKRKPRRKFER